MSRIGGRLSIEWLSLSSPTDNLRVRIQVSVAIQYMVHHVSAKSCDLPITMKIVDALVCILSTIC